jgi:biotin carboxyl carrier protein
VKLNITIKDKTFEVDVEAVEPESPVQTRPLGKGPAPVRVPAAPVAAPPPAVSDKAVDENKVCRSPVAGIVIRIAAQVGQSIQTGDILLVLEAMKMETNITAPGSGKVAAIPVNEGDGVQSGQILVEFE